MYRIAEDTEEGKKYYLTNTSDSAIESFLGHSYVFGTVDIRLFQTKSEANKVLKDMHRYNTGRRAYVEEVK